MATKTTWHNATFILRWPRRQLIYSLLTNVHSSHLGLTQSFNRNVTAWADFGKTIEKNDLTMTSYNSGMTMKYTIVVDGRRRRNGWKHRSETLTRLTKLPQLHKQSSSLRSCRSIPKFGSSAVYWMTRRQIKLCYKRLVAHCRESLRRSNSIMSTPTRCHPTASYRSEWMSGWTGQSLSGKFRVGQTECEWRSFNVGIAVFKSISRHTSKSRSRNSVFRLLTSKQSHMQTFHGLQPLRNRWRVVLRSLQVN